MSRTSSFDAVIIGAGVIGCSIALALARKGYSTLNVDRLPAAGYGSTSSSAAIIRPYY
jgi:sarcosine oxidase subunit beta